MDNSVVMQAVEELAHWEMIATMIFKLTQGATISDVRTADFGGHYAIWDSAIFPGDSNGVPWSAGYINTMGDPIADLHEDMAAEQKARATYENLIRLTDDTDLQDGLKFLREREVVAPCPPDTAPPVIVHAFQKKTLKTPKPKLDTAIARMKDHQTKKGDSK